MIYTDKALEKTGVSWLNATIVRGLPTLKPLMYYFTP